MKLKSSAISIVLILITILSSLGIKNVTEDNLEDYIEKDAVAVADFIEDNFGKFVYEYNATSEEEWQATYIENRYDILISECGDEYDGVFLDFDGANGYAVVGNDYNLLDFNVNEESPYLGITFDKCMYSTVTGYLYELNGECLSVNPEYNVDESIYDTEFSASMKHYDGQDKDFKGCGRINNTDKYVKDKYGSGWTLYKSNRLEMTGNMQNELSVYKKNYIFRDDKNQEMIEYESEENCWIVSAYTAMQYLADNKTEFSKLPKSAQTSAYYPAISEPKIYGKYFDKNGKNISGNIKNSQGKVVSKKWDLMNASAPNFPDLYIQMRKSVNKLYANINQGNIYQVEKIVKDVAKTNGINVNTEVAYTLLTSSNKAKSAIDKGYPFLWGTFGDTYGNHLMAACGYTIYSKTTGWWIFKVTSYKTFYEVKDGWDALSRYFDVNGYYCVGAVLTVNYKGVIN